MDLNYLLSSVSDYFNAISNSISPWIYFSVGILKIVFIVISLALFVGAIILLFKATWIKRRYFDNVKVMADYKFSGAKKIFKEWQKITKRLETDIEAEYKLAIIEADGLFDAILAKMGYGGDVTDEKLKKIEPAVLANINDISGAHKIRDNIIYDPDYKLDLEKAKEMIGIYEQALRDLEVF